MTKKEKVTIYRLKRKGYTASNISKVTGVPYGTIRSMFSRHPEYKEEGVCQCCGKHFEITIINPFKRFCSKECKQAFWNNNRKIEHRKSTVKQICPCCGKEFINYGIKEQIYCSRDCYHRMRLIKNKQWRSIVSKLLEGDSSNFFLFASLLATIIIVAVIAANCCK